jgi:hypothetical protein
MKPICLVCKVVRVSFALRMSVRRMSWNLAFQTAEKSGEQYCEQYDLRGATVRSSTTIARLTSVPVLGTNREHTICAMASVVTKILSPSFYQQQYKAFLVSSYNYYHPMFRSGRLVRHLYV